MYFYVLPTFGPRIIVRVCIEKLSCDDSFTEITWEDLKDTPTLKKIILNCLKNNGTYCKYQYETTPEEWKMIKKFIEVKGRKLKIGCSVENKG